MGDFGVEGSGESRAIEGDDGDPWFRRILHRAIAVTYVLTLVMLGALVVERCAALTRPSGRQHSAPTRAQESSP
jgi:hypothetical protein